MSLEPRIRASSARSLLGVRAGETALVAWVSATFFVTQTTHGLGLNAADALFFRRFGVEHLPLMILISGGVVMLGMLAYWVGLSSTRDRGWLWRVPIASAGWVALERWGIAVDAAGIYPVVWLSAQVVMMVTFTLMWTAAAEVCTTRQAKRLYPLFASAGIGGGILGNALTGPAASLLGTENLVVVQAGLLLASGALTLGTARRFFPEGQTEPATSAREDLRAGFRVTAGTPLLRLVALVTAATSILLFLVMFPFSEVVASSFDTEAGIASFLGWFSSVATAATLLVSLLVANRLFSRLGVVGTLLILPVTYLAGFGLWLVRFDLVTASLVRGAQWIALNALGATALNSLYNVLRGRRRAQAIAFVTAVPAQVGTAIAGLLLVVSEVVSDGARLAVSLAVAAGSTLVVLRMRRAYVAALVAAVDKGLVDVFTASPPGLPKPDLDADSRAALAAGIDDPDPARRRVAVSMLGRLDDDSARTLLRSAVHDPDPSVRLTAFDAFRDPDDPWAVAVALELLGDPDAGLRLRAARVLVASDVDPPRSAIEGLLGDPDPHVRAAGARLAGAARGVPVVTGLLESPDRTHVAAGLEAVSEGLRPEGADLGRFASHEDPAVRRAAARALTAEEGATAILRALLDDVFPSVRSAAAQTLGVRPDGPDVLYEVLETGSVRASEAALTVLAASDGRHRLGPWIEHELDRATVLHHRRGALGAPHDGDPPARRYLVRVLTARQRRLERWILEALGAAEGIRPLGTVSRGAWSDDPETRSQALEALESMTGREHARRLVPLIEDSFDGPVSDARRALWDLTGDFDPWLRALAARCLADDLAADLNRLAGAVEGDESELVRSAVSPWIGAEAASGGILDPLDRVLALQEVGLLADLDPEELRLVADVTEERRYSPGETIYRKGEVGDEMLVIVEGGVEVGVGRPTPLVRAAGQHVGELAVLRRRPRSADVVAGSQGTRALVVTGADLRETLEERPEVTVAMLRTLAERIVELGPV